MPETILKKSLIKPTVNTPFHIDFDWWQDNDSNWRIFLQSFLCEEHQKFYIDKDENIKIDAIDPQTAEVKQVDGVLHTLITHCAKQEEFLNENVPLIAKILRIFLSNGNHPLTPQELSPKVNRPAMTILITITGPQVYKGIRPFLP